MEEGELEAHGSENGLRCQGRNAGVSFRPTTQIINKLQHRRCSSILEQEVLQHIGAGGAPAYWSRRCSSILEQEVLQHIGAGGAPIRTGGAPAYWSKRCSSILEQEVLQLEQEVLQHIGTGGAPAYWSRCSN